MGTLIRFPDVKFSPVTARRTEPAQVVILPVVRVERQDPSCAIEPPPTLDAPRSGRRRSRARRS